LQRAILEASAIYCEGAKMLMAQWQLLGDLKGSREMQEEDLK
jgi:hypothetical protein